MADAEPRQIGRQRGGVAEAEPLVELQAVGRPGDRRRQTSLFVSPADSWRCARPRKISAMSMKRGRAASSSNVIDRRRRQFGCSSEVAGTFTGSASSVRSSICAIARTTGVRARKACTARARSGCRALRRSAADLRCGALPKAASDRARASDAGARPRPARERGRAASFRSRSRASHQPRRVGRSWLPTTARALSPDRRRAAESAGLRLLLEDTARGRKGCWPPPCARGNPRARCRDPRRRQASVTMAFERENADQILHRIADIGAVEGFLPCGTQ